MTHVLIFTEGDFEGIESLEDSGRAMAFALGLVRGANLYGAGACTGYVMPAEMGDMREAESPAAVSAALDALAKVTL